MRNYLEVDAANKLCFWIDLIFGFSSRGDKAKEIMNVFEGHSYEEFARNQMNHISDP